MNKRKAIYGIEDSESKHLKNGEWDFHDEETQPHLHALHPYPARFIPQIPRRAIKLWSSPGDVVLDPFCGCGTTILESILWGRSAIGVDNNAVAVLVSQAKISHYSHKDLNVLIDFVRGLNWSTINPKLKVVLPKYHNSEYWFTPEAMSDLGKLKAVIDELPPKPKLFSTAIFSSIIVRVSNQDSDTRYAKIERAYVPGSAIKWFQKKMKDTIDRLEGIIELPKADAVIYCRDGRDLSNISNRSVNLIVTSPPYINAYDYHKYHRHRLHWIDGDISLARDAEIGKHDTFTRPKATPDRYFEDMFRCFEQWSRILIPGGHLFIVTGDGIVSGKPVPVGERFIELCQKVGLKFKERWIRNLKKNSKSFNQRARIDEEHLILFSKS